MAKPGSGKRKMTANRNKQYQRGDKLLKSIFKLLGKLFDTILNIFLKIIFK